MGPKYTKMRLRVEIRQDPLPYEVCFRWRWVIHIPQIPCQLAHQLHNTSRVHGPLQRVYTTPKDSEGPYVQYDTVQGARPIPKRVFLHLHYCSFFFLSNKCQ